MEELDQNEGVFPVSTDNVRVGLKGASSDGEAITDLPVVTANVGSSSNDRCDVCRATGLAILPTRYSVVPKACSGLGQIDSGRGCAVDISSANYAYALRTLRQGMLYLFYEQGPHGTNYWEAYAVAQNGTLWRQPSAGAARRILGGGVPTCAREGHQSERMEFLVIQKPHQCGKVWLAFSQDRWTDATLDRYASDVRLRAERMQDIEPAKWIKAPTPAEYHAPIATPDDLKAIMEYASFNAVVGDHPELPYFGKPGAISRDDGGHIDGELHRNSTRYPWSLRNQKLPTDAEADMSLESSYTALRGASKRGDDFHTPMLLAIWDPIGIVHELNGYRHDVLGHMARYYQERGKELDAIEGFQQIKVLLEQNAGVLANRFSKASRSRLREEVAKGDGYVNSGLLRQERQIMTEHRPLYDRYTRGELEWPGYLSQREALIQRHAALYPYGDERYDPSARRREIGSRFAFHDDMRRMDRPSFWEGLSGGMIDGYRREATEKWESTYRPLFDESAIITYERNVAAFLGAAVSLLSVRSQALGAWLQNELFLVALEDYDTADRACGAHFEEAITEAVNGLNVDPIGSGILKSLADNLDVTERSCLLWRVVAQNQQDARQELQELLAEADSLKDTALDAVGASWGTFTTAASRLKKFLGIYKKVEEATREAVPSSSSNAALRASGVDRFVVATGAVLLDRFPLKHVDGSVGNALARHVLQVRAGIDAAESSNLINVHAAQDPHLKRYFHERVVYYRGRVGARNGAMMFAMRDLESQHGTSVLRAQWQRVASRASNPIRLAGLTGVLEVVNFVSILSREDKSSRDYGALLASGLSLASVYASVGTTVSKELLTDASKSFSNLKAVGSGLGGVATIIGVVFDVESFVDSIGSKRYESSIAYGLKAVAGSVFGLTQILTALSYTAPVLQRVTGPGRTIMFLTNVRYGIEGAAATRTAIAGGKAASTVAIRQGAMVGLGRFVLYMAGWQVAVGITAVQGLIWVFSPNALEDWCERNHFGNVREKNMLGFGGSDTKYMTQKEQSEAFGSAITDVGIAPEPSS